MTESNQALKRHLEALSEPRNPIEHPEAHRRARLYLQDQLESQGRSVERFPFPTADHPTGGLNLHSRGRNEDTRYLLVAHYDTVAHSPGADDNGSAVAVALEVSRRCPQIDCLFPDLEERGLLGSRHFTQHHRSPWKLVLVLESVGFMNSSPGSQSYPEVLPTAFPGAYETMRGNEFRGDFWTVLHLTSQLGSSNALESCLQDPTVKLGLPDELYDSEVPSELLDFGRSDHLAFWEQGIPCLMLTDTANFRNPNYHQPTDTIDTLDFPAMERLVESLTEFFNQFQDP